VAADRSHGMTCSRPCAASANPRLFSSRIPAVAPLPSNISRRCICSIASFPLSRGGGLGPANVIGLESARACREAESLDRSGQLTPEITIWHVSNRIRKIIFVSAAAEDSNPEAAASRSLLERDNPRRRGAAVQDGPHRARVLLSSVFRLDPHQRVFTDAMPERLIPMQPNDALGKALRIG
jgi:hypothetical protein